MTKTGCTKEIWRVKMKKDLQKNGNYIDFDKKDEVELESILRIIYRAKFIILLLVVLAVLGANWYVSRKPVSYSSVLKFSQNNKNVAIFEENTVNIVNSDFFMGKIIKDTDIKEKYAQAHNIKDISSLKDSDIIRWLKGSISVAFVKNAGNEGSFTDVTVTTSTEDKEMAVYIAKKYYEVLNNTLNEKRVQYADRKIKYLEQKVELLKNGRSNEQIIVSSQNGNKILTAYEQALDELAEAKLLKSDYRELLTIVNDAQSASLVKASKTKYLIVGVGGGAFLGVFAVFLWDLIRAINWRRVISK
jgi:uncharacterized protein involved in exopolysaccharide biosynthesis